MSLTGNYDPENIFAKILNGDMPCVKIYENDHVLAFMDVFPQSRGHVLVIPKTPARNFLDVEPESLSPLIIETQRLAKAVHKSLSPDGIRIMQFNGAPAGQTVFHLHFHIIPIYAGQDMQGHASGKMADMDELAKIAAQIQSEIIF